jgi:hypothetical protein
LRFIHPVSRIQSRVESESGGHSPGTEPKAQTWQVDRVRTLCNDGAVQDRNLKIVRFIGATPSVAYCDLCRLTFRTRQEFLLDADKAKQQLQSDFEKHECKPEEGMVNDALAAIR